MKPRSVKRECHEWYWSKKCFEKLEPWLPYFGLFDIPFSESNLSYDIGNVTWPSSSELSKLERSLSSYRFTISTHLAFEHLQDTKQWKSVICISHDLSLNSQKLAKVESRYQPTAGLSNFLHNSYLTLPIIQSKFESIFKVRLSTVFTRLSNLVFPFTS